MSTYYYPPGAFKALCRIEDESAVKIYEMIEDAMLEQKLWLAKVIVDRIDKAPDRVYSLFCEMVQAAIHGDPPAKFPEEAWCALVDLHPSQFIRSIPITCYQFARFLAADDNEVEAREWIRLTNSAIHEYAERYVGGR